MPTIETTEQELSVKDALENWVRSLAGIVVHGKPFFNEGEFDFTFGSESDIYHISIKKSANNIVAFPQKETKKLPPRI